MAMPAPDFSLCLFLIPERVVCYLHLVCVYTLVTNSSIFVMGYVMLEIVNAILKYGICPMVRTFTSVLSI